LKGQDNIQAYADLVKEYDDRTLGYEEEVKTDYQNALTAYTKAFDDYKLITRSADLPAIETLLDETYMTACDIAESVKSTVNFLQFVQDIMLPRKLKVPASTVTYLTNLDSYTGQVNGHLSSLLGIQTTIKNARGTIVDADRSITEKTESLKKLQAGADALDIQSSKLTVTQRENSLQDAKEKLADYTVRAPFDGRIAKVNVKKGDTASSSTAIATLLAHQQIAEIALNEVDVAKVKMGQKVTLTFDAVEGLSISGEVAEIDAVGTVSQGVVSYTVKISFDTQDDRVKPGMSVTAAIITDAKPDVLAVPNSAVQTQGTAHYVEIADGQYAAQEAAAGVVLTSPARRQMVEIGIANDSSTEITSGLSEGDQVIVRTITASSQTATPTTQTGGNALFGGNRGLGGGAAGGAVRIQTR
jgi:RND family efflux transporter MFP subunit